MFRKMRLEENMTSAEEAVEMLKKATNGVLAVLGDDDYPYAVPLSYVYNDGKIYFHGTSAVSHKIEAIKKHPKVSFCVITQDNILPEKFNTLYRSVIVFGKARVSDRPKGNRAGAHDDRKEICRRLYGVGKKIYERRNRKLLRCRNQYRTYDRKSRQLIIIKRLPGASTMPTARRFTYFHLRFKRPMSFLYCAPSKEILAAFLYAFSRASSWVSPKAVTPSTRPPSVTIADSNRFVAA